MRRGVQNANGDYNAGIGASYLNSENRSPNLEKHKTYNNLDSNLETEIQ